MTSSQFWRREAERSANPARCIEYAENLERLEADKLARPEHYRRKPQWASEYQWMQEQ